MSVLDQIRPEEKAGRRGVAGISMLGALIAGFLASACCIGPLLLIFLGLSGAGALMVFEPYRPFFMGLTLVLLLAAFFVVYRRPQVGNCAGDGCSIPKNRRVQKVLLWLATLFVLLMLFSPQLLPLVLE